MIQNESLPVWHYGRGRALTTGRITYVGTDPADLNDYRIEGALKWERATMVTPGGPVVMWKADLDADGITPIIYASADLLSSTAGSEAIRFATSPIPRSASTSTSIKRSASLQS